MQKVCSFPCTVWYNLVTPLVWDWTGALLSNILDYQTVHILTYIRAGNFLLLLMYLGCTIC
jgi:hypothetical protein